MTKWEADYPFYHYLRAGHIEATVAVDENRALASVVGTIDTGRTDLPNEVIAKKWCKDELRKIRDKINEALEEE